jgi:hypothetical protein
MTTLRIKVAAKLSGDWSAGRALATCGFNWTTVLLSCQPCMSDVTSERGDDAHIKSDAASQLISIFQG